MQMKPTKNDQSPKNCCLDEFLTNLGSSALSVGVSRMKSLAVKQKHTAGGVAAAAD